MENKGGQFNRQESPQGGGTNRTIKAGLRSLPKDRRDYNHAKVFGTISLPDEDFLVGNPLDLEPQVADDTCGAHILCRIRGLTEKKRLAVAYQWLLIREVIGNPDSWGASMRDVGKAGIRGSLSQEECPFTIQKQGRDFVANAANWNKTNKGNRFELDMRARKHKADSFFFIDNRGYRDVFDGFRGALTMHRHRYMGIQTGLMWCFEWEQAKNKIVEEYRTPIAPHFIGLIGQKIIGNEPYLVVLNTDNKIYNFSRKVINQGCKYGAIMFNDMPQKEARKKAWSGWQRLIYRITRMLL